MTSRVNDAQNVVGGRDCGLAPRRDGRVGHLTSSITRGIALGARDLAEPGSGVTSSVGTIAGCQNLKSER